jgi:hypothetical protein
MYAIEQQIRVKLEFRAMEKPVEISVPWNVLGYLDLHAERKLMEDGSVIYRVENSEELLRRMGQWSLMTAA